MNEETLAEDDPAIRLPRPPVVFEGILSLVKAKEWLKKKGWSLDQESGISPSIYRDVNRVLVTIVLVLN